MAEFKDRFSETIDRLIKQKFIITSVEMSVQAFKDVGLTELSIVGAPITIMRHWVNVKANIQFNDPKNGMPNTRQVV